MGKSTRRAFLAGAAGVAATAALPRWTRAIDAAFPHGVASFDPLADRVVIWTRTTAAPTVTWQVARDEGFTNVVQTGTASAATARDFTVHVDVAGLQPATTYWYRFRAGDATSTVGRMRTLPTPGAVVDRVRVGITTCAEWEFGRFGGYRLVAERDDLDFVLALGDYVYEFGRSYGPIPSPQPGGRQHVPAHECHTLADYRARHQQYRSDPELQLMHARHTVVAMYDDHEVANDWWRGGAEQHTVPDEGDWPTRRNAALQAFGEWVPMRADPADPTKVYRRFQIGGLVELFMVDARLYRDAPPTNALIGYGSVDPAVEDPDRTMLGVAQRDWLLQGLERSAATWKVLGNPVSMMPIHVGPALAGVLGSATAGLGTPLPPLPPPLLIDGWDGFNAERTRLLNFVNDRNIEDVVVLTGDYHESFATELPYDKATYDLDGNAAAVEFIAPAITSPTLAETLELAGLPEGAIVDALFEANLALSNHWVKYHEGVSQGYGVAEFRADGMQYDFWFLDDRNRADTAAHHGSSWTVARGASVLAAAAGPLGPRAPIHTAASAGPQPTGVIPRTGAEQPAALAVGAAAVVAAAAARKFRGKLQDPPG